MTTNSLQYTHVTTRARTRARARARARVGAGAWARLVHLSTVADDDPAFLVFIVILAVD